jgi:hydrogenase maturation protease
LNANLVEELQRFWRGNTSPRIIIIGVGRSMRGDEHIGLLVADELEKMTPNKTMVIRAEDRPENYTDKIRSYNPTHIIYMLASRSGLKPGETKLITLEEHTNLSLHESPLTTLNHYLSAFLNIQTRLLLIEPRTEFGSPTSGLRKTAMKIALQIFQSLP